MEQLRACIVDLNNFARYPSIAVGYLTAVLREGDIKVDVFSPLSFGVKGVVREVKVRPWTLYDHRLRYRMGFSGSRAVRVARDALRRWRRPGLAGATARMAEAFDRRLDAGYDVVLVSTYLMYYDLCAEICRRAQARGVPVVLGGPYFSQPEVNREWCGLEGLTALIAGEVEPYLVDIVKRAVQGNDMHGVSGVWRGAGSSTAPPLKNLDALPFPDYSDFPWTEYPNRVVPVVTGRGCGWGACSFCSDITSSAGRTFRSRTPQNVLAEVRHQAERHDARLFVFTDLKLNSNQLVWRELIDGGMQKAAPQSRWVCSVHVGREEPEGLEQGDLEAARQAGLVRLTTGLESGSQRVLDSMKKGVKLERLSTFFKNAAAAGLSARTTMIVGYPGEEVADVEASADFVSCHSDCIERISLNRFQIMSGTKFHRELESNGVNGYDLEALAPNHRMAVVEHLYRGSATRAYRRAVDRLLGVIHAVNRRPLSAAARPFEGVM